MSSRLSAGLPLNIHEKGKSNSCELCDVLFSSLGRFCPGDLFETFFIVCPTDQKQEVSAYMKQWEQWPIHVVDEMTLVPEF